MIPAVNLIDARARDFVSKDELLLPILKAFAECSRLLHTARSVWCFRYECVCGQIAELSSVYFTEYRHTQHHSATHLGYKFRLNISHHQACSVRHYSVK